MMNVLLGLVAFLSMASSYSGFQQQDTVDVKNFPRIIGSWTSQEIPLTSQQLAILETTNTFIRKYSTPQGQSVYLYIVYSQTNRKVSHPPEICYTGNGITITDKGRQTIPVAYNHLQLMANRLVLKGSQLHQVAFYWFKIGRSMTPSYWKEQSIIAFNRLLGKRTGSALIRISADCLPNQQAAINSIKQFTSLITPQLFTYLP